MTMTDTNIIEEFKSALSLKNENTEQLFFKLGDVDFQGSGDRIAIGKDHQLGMTTNAFNHLAGIAGIPTSYASKITDDLLAYNMNYLLGGRKDGHYAALVEGDVVRSFMPTTSPYVPAEDIFNTIEDVFDGDYDLKYVKIGEDITSFSILPHEYRNAIDGSNLFGGLKVRVSDSWSVSPTFDTYIWRELCSNGMIESLKNKRFRIQDASPAEVLDKVAEFARASLSQIPELFDSYNALLAEPVIDYANVISRICSDHKISSKVRDRILFWAVQDDFLITVSDRRIKNMHDVVNLFTYVGSHDSTLSDDIRHLLMQIGGAVTMDHHDRCSSCGGSV
jgi:hypothetical protein